MGLYFLVAVIAYTLGVLTVIGLASLHFAGEPDDTDQAGA